MYNDLFNIIHTHIYSGVTMTSDQNLVCTLIATIGCLLFVGLPFFLVYKILAFVVGLGSR